MADPIDESVPLPVESLPDDEPLPVEVLPVDPVPVEAMPVGTEPVPPPLPAWPTVAVRPPVSGPPGLVAAIGIFSIIVAGLSLVGGGITTLSSMVVYSIAQTQATMPAAANATAAATASSGTPGPATPPAPPPAARPRRDRPTGPPPPGARPPTARPSPTG